MTCDTDDRVRLKSLQDQVWGLLDSGYPDLDPLAELWPGGLSKAHLAVYAAEPKHAARIEALIEELEG